MRRREFFALVGGAAAWPVAVCAQHAMPVIGYLSSRSQAESAHLVGAFREGLLGAGYVENQHVRIEYRWADAQFDRLPRLASDLVGRQVAVIATAGNTVSALAAKAATPTIPIVFVIGDDPIKVGLVDSLRRPSGNATGVTVLFGPLGPKRLEVLHELLPKEAIIGVLMNPSGPGARAATKDLEDAARGIGRRLVVRTASRAEDLEPTFRAFRDDGATGILLIDDPFFGTQRGPIAILAENFRMPLIGSQRDWAVIGALMGYGPDLRDGYRQCGNYAGQILRGTKPADLPVVQAPRIALVINLKTATALGVIVPPTLLARADEVIE